MKQYTFYIDTGSGYIQFYPLYENLSWENNKDDENVFPLESISGDIIFSGSEYTTLYSLLSSNNTLPFQMKYDGVLKFTGYIDLVGSYDIIKKQCFLKITHFDHYEKILKRAAETINIFGNVDTKSIYITGTSPLAFCYKIDDIIKYIVEEFTDDVLFDSDSFKAFENLDSNWKNIYLTTLYNTRYGYTGFVSQEANIIFEELFKMLRELFHIYWKVDIISGLKYFRLVHISGVSYSLGSFDLTNYKGKSWRSKDDRINYSIENRISLIQRSSNAGQLDFKGLDIEIPAFSETPQVKEISLNPFYFDIEHILDYPSDIPFDTDKWLLMCVDENERATTLTLTGDTVLRINPLLSVDFDFDYLWPNPSRVTLTKIGASSTGAILFQLEFQPQYVNLQYRLTVKTSLTNPLTTEKFYVRNKDVNEGWGTSTFIQIWQDEFGGDGYVNVHEVDLTETSNQNIDLGVVGQSTGGGNMYVYFIVEGIPPSQVLEIDTITVVQYTSLDIISTAGILEPSVTRMNMPLSLSNIDDKAGKWEMPASPAIINGVSTVVNTKQNIGVNDIIFPLNDLSEVDFDYLTKTIYGNVQPVNLLISLKTDFAKLKGNIL